MCGSCQHQHGIHTPNPACASGLSESLCPSTSLMNKKTSGWGFAWKFLGADCNWGWNLVPPFRPSNEADESGMEKSGVTRTQKGMVICHGWQGHVDSVRRYPWTTAVGSGCQSVQRLLWHHTESTTGHQKQNCPGVCLCSTITHAHMLPTLRRFGWGVLDHPPYSPDLSPCDYHTFGPLKNTLKGRRFIQQPVSFVEGITTLVQRWDKCLNSGGQYL
jgi:hypothetical protein